MNLTRDTIQPTTGVWWELEAEVQGRAPAQTSSLPGHGQAGMPPSPPASPGCVLLLSPQPQAADGPKQTAAKEDHQTPGANQMSGNEKVAHEEYHLIRLHHLSKTDGLFIGLWQF